MKLRRLVLAGFKSFADRTEFVFDDGITCVVGPNGCGKSNVVDAVKWVLGEQSAKSLRGAEMMDVIFNGSGTRRASGVCEVTLEFDNEQGRLQPAMDPADPKRPHVVSVTRRLYRSGESEYLINGRVARLRDIREMFMDTGVGTIAYSIIEQGRVAELLQANPLDRRVIFEEAAGISKYKARKKEALRKLERVQQDLLRVNDVLAEVQKRLRSIKYQAAKARNYQDYAQRLKELRALHSLAQYHHLRAERLALQGQLDELTDRFTSVASRADQLEANGASVETELTELERQARQNDGEIAAVGAQITMCEQRADMLAARVRELAEQVVQARRHDQDLQDRAERAARSAGEHEEQLRTVELRLAKCAEVVEALLADQREGQLALTALEASLEDEKAGAIELMRRTSRLNNEVTAAGVRRENLTTQRRRLQDQAQAMAGKAQALQTERDEHQEQARVLAERIEQATAELDAAKSETLAVAQAEADLDRRINAAKERRSSLASRRSTLEEMQRKGEGVAEGARRVLAAAKQGQLPFVRGILAEFIHTDMEHAAVVEAALAGLDQSVVADSLEAMEAHRPALDRALKGGSVELLCLDRLGDAPERFDVSALPVPARRLADLVRLEGPLAGAAEALLGSAYVVEDLPAARQAGAALPRGHRLVTADGVVLEAGGVVRLGTGRGSGVISRRSELAKLSESLEALAGEIEQLTGQRQVAAGRRKHLDQVQQELRSAIFEANTQRVNHHSRSTRADEQLVQLERERPIIERDIEAIGEEIAQTHQAEAAARSQVESLDAQAAQRQQAIEQLGERIAQARSRRDHLAGQLTERRVENAELSQQRGSLHETIRQLRRSVEQMQRQRAESAAQIETAGQRRADAETGIAEARATIEQQFARRNELEQTAQDIEQSRAGLAERLEQIRAELVTHRRSRQELDAQANRRRVEIGEADVRIENLITRTGEELGLDLVNAFGDYTHDGERDWDAVATEIHELRGKIERLGNVNLDAITEQQELETRDQFLTEQVADIDKSRNQLAELIETLNHQSLDLFRVTFEAIRETFHGIFRKLFGGGKADILLTDPDDLLESGIEIVARPPGKELRSITLLSGGEKTMATVALLFSIFRTKPSPFCILDEVDAALDEANNERFNGIVQDFLDQSQFIVITHSKRTMAIGDALYGVTMQEPGVSRRVSVKFEEAASLVEDEPVAAGT